MKLPRLMFAWSFLVTLPAAAWSADALSLWGAMERAAQSNPEIRAREVEVRKQELEQEIARGQHLPKIDLNASYTRYAYPSLVTPIRQAGVFPPLDRDIAGIGLALNLPLYAGGKLVAGELLAAQGRDAAFQALRATGQELLFNVAATFTKALQFRHLAGALDSRIRTLEQEERNTVQRIEQGRAARLELLRLQTQLTQARHDRLTVAQGEKDALALLASLLGTSGKLPPLEEIDAAHPVVPVTLAEALGRATANRPDLLELRAQGKAAEAKTAIARGDRRPQVNLLGKIQETSGGDLDGYGDWQLGVELSMPLYDGAIRDKRLDQARMEQRQSEMRLEDAQNRLASEVEQALGRLTEARSRLAVANQGQVEAEEALRIESLRYESGESTATDLLAAETAFWDATVNRIQANYDVTVGEARLLRAMGELSAHSFKPGAAGKAAGAGLVSPEPAPLGLYLSWHDSALACAQEGERMPLRTATPGVRGRLEPVRSLSQGVEQ